MRSPRPRLDLLADLALLHLNSKHCLSNGELYGVAFRFKSLNRIDFVAGIVSCDVLAFSSWFLLIVRCLNSSTKGGVLLVEILVANDKFLDLFLKALTDYQSAESEQLMKRLRPGGHGIDEATYPAPIPQPAWSVDDLPRRVACSLSHGSNVTSMDFHPTRHTLLLVGSANGEFTLYEIGLHETLLSKPFKIWDINACSPQFQVFTYKLKSYL
ncbi:Protein TPR1 [Zea mays]|uniref:Protein TPR1 n=1 Tax=Zea mays TaxID=4577 RepID=A0A3L6DTU5_MAIZE|nr:Protein TPR1 [Zea mays]